MAVAQLPASHAPVSDAPPPAPVRPRVVMVATAFSVAGAAMFFAGLLGIYLLLRADALSAGTPWLPEGSFFPLQQPNVILFALISSSVTVQWAVDAIRRDDRPQAFLALGVTLVLGIAVVNMWAYLYSILKLDIAIQSPMPALVYTITGAHLLMLLVAMIYLGLMTFRALGGQFTSRQHDGMSAAALFWHAMVAVYAIIWISIFVTK